MTIHSAGTLTIAISVAILTIANLLVGFLSLSILPWTLIVSLLLLVLLLIFFRSPKREVELNDSAVLSSVDGQVVVIEETEETEILHTRCLQISVFMTLLNVHINWYPVNGKVFYCEHHNGLNLPAFRPKSSTDNERTTIAIHAKTGDTIVMRQIAGTMARRVVTYARPGDDALQNRQAGFIRFGSRVDIFVPLSTDIQVQLGDVVKGGRTILGYLQNQPLCPQKEQ